MKSCAAWKVNATRIVVNWDVCCIIADITTVCASMDRIPWYLMLELISKQKGHTDNGDKSSDILFAKVNHLR